MRFFAALIFLFYCVGVFAQDTLLISHVREGEVWRTVDQKGNYVLRQTFEVRPSLYDIGWDNIVFRQNKKYGIVDYKDKIIAPPVYDFAQPFYDKYAVVNYNGKWGIIDRHNKFVVPPKYDYASPFGADGWAGVVKDGKLGFVDTTGKIVIPFKNRYWTKPYGNFNDYTFIGFFDGLVAFENKPRNGKVGFMDKRGRVVIKPKYELDEMRNAPDFRGGLAVVYQNGQPHVIDTRDSVIYKPGPDVAIFYPNNTGGYTVATEHFQRFGLLDSNFNTLLPMTHEHIGWFNDGYALVEDPDSDSNRPFYYINRNGKHIFNQRFKEAEEFSDGLAAVKINGKWGFIDTTGQLRIQAIYDDVESFWEGFAAVAQIRSDTIWYGFIDSNGKTVIPLKFRSADSFHDGLALVEVNGLFGFIDRNGAFVVEPRFEEAWPFWNWVIR